MPHEGSFIESVHGFSICEKTMTFIGLGVVDGKNVPLKFHCDLISNQERLEDEKEMERNYCLCYAYRFLLSYGMWL